MDHPPRGYEGIFRPAGGRPPHVHMQYACTSILGGYEGIPQAPLGLPVHTYLAKIPNPGVDLGLEPHSEGRAWGCKLQLCLRRSYTDVGGTPSRARNSARRARGPFSGTSSMYTARLYFLHTGRLASLQVDCRQERSRVRGSRVAPSAP